MKGGLAQVSWEAKKGNWGIYKNFNLLTLAGISMKKPQFSVLRALEPRTTCLQNKSLGHLRWNSKRKKT